MNKLIVSLLLVFISAITFASEGLTIKSRSYEEAKAKTDYIVFNMESTKAGMITTSFDGIVKDASINYVRTKSSFKNINIKIVSKGLDTDNDSRNDKMYEKCLSVDKYPEIKISIVGPLRFNKDNVAKIHIRGKSYPIKVLVKYDESKGLLSGRSTLSLKGLKIPDPSIWIASVDDSVEVNFQVKVK